MTKGERFQLRLSRTDKRLAFRLARGEHRTLSNFIITLIHDRAALVNRLDLARVSAAPAVDVEETNRA